MPHNYQQIRLSLTIDSRWHGRVVCETGPILSNARPTPSLCQNPWVSKFGQSHMSNRGDHPQRPLPGLLQSRMPFHSVGHDRAHRLHDTFRKDLNTRSSGPVAVHPPLSMARTSRRRNDACQSPVVVTWRAWGEDDTGLRKRILFGSVNFSNGQTPSCTHTAGLGLST
jgi:hypothetical protein